MRNDDIAYALGCVDAQYILEAADTASGNRRHRIKWSAVAACLILAGMLTISAAIATGMLDSLLSYYIQGETENYMEEILSPAGSVSNEKLQLRIEGAIADRDTCYMVVSFIGLTEKEKTKLERAEISKDIEIYGLLENGERVKAAAKSVGTYMQKSVSRKAKSFFKDASQTYIISYRPKEYSISNIQKVCLGYGGLVLELEVAKHMSPEYALVSEEGSSDAITDLRISRVGLSFIQPIMEEMSEDDFNYEIKLIRADGTVLTDEEMREIGVNINSSFGFGMTEVKITGNWGRVPAIAIINLDDYCGVQINGTNYYYIDS